MRLHTHRCAQRGLRSLPDQVVHRLPLVQRRRTRPVHHHNLLPSRHLLRPVEQSTVISHGDNAFFWTTALCLWLPGTSRLCYCIPEHIGK